MAYSSVTISSRTPSEVSIHSLVLTLAKETSPVFTTMPSKTSLKDLIADHYYQGADELILPAGLLPTGFFDLQNGVAGALLQTISNFRMRVAIVGDFSAFRSPSQLAFLAEASRSNAVRYVATDSEALEWLPNAKVLR